MSICNNENYYSSKNRQEFLLKGKTRHTYIITTVSSFNCASHSRIVLTNLTFLLYGAIACPVIPDF